MGTPYIITYGSYCESHQLVSDPISIQQQILASILQIPFIFYLDLMW